MTQVIPGYTNINGVPQRANVITSDKAVILSDGRTLKDVVDESKEIKKGIKNALDDMESINVDTFSPVIIQTTSIGKIGKDDNIDVSASVNDGFFKSAILKGQTLVNLFDIDSVTDSPNKQGIYTDWITFSNNGSANYWKPYYNVVSRELTTGEKLIAFLYVDTNTIGDVTVQAPHNGYYLFPMNFGVISSTGVFKSNPFVINYAGGKTKDGEINFRCITSSPTVGEFKFRLLITPYQDGMENWDIPYFEGMQSVRMPVLTTIGKNLFNENLPLENGYIDGNGNKTSSALYEWINQEHFVDGGESLIISYKNRVGNATVRLAEYGETGFIKRTNLANNKTKITLTANTKRVILSVDKGTTYFEELQIEYGTVATIYESYKTNILTCNEEVVLRSLPNGVNDTLNLITGEYIQRIGEVKITDEMIDKLYMYSNFINSFQFIFDGLPKRKIETFFSTPSMFSDKMITKPWSDRNMAENLVYFSQYRDGVMRVYHSPDWTLDEFKEWFRENKPTIIYELETPIVKTVPINGEPLGFKDGYIMLFSRAEGHSLIPTLEYSVPVSKAAQIAQNSVTLVRQSKQIYSLEILMMSASIEDAYRRLLLQNDVEVTRSINANLEANPLRYYVLSKLIEENAYNVDDMLDKLDIFSLYNEITIDQYIELSDNVLGINEDIIEGEIIED